MDNKGLNEKWYTFDVESVFQRLQSGRSGLKSEDVKNRLLTFGFNELPEKKRISPLGIFLSQFKNYLVLILIGAAIISAFTGEETNAFVILFIILFISVLGFVQEYRAERAMEALKKMVAFEARVLRDGAAKKIPIKEPVPGDIIYIEAGDRIPADARLVEAINLETLESSLTGESHPVSKSTEALREDTPVAEWKNMVFMGTVAARGNGIAAVAGTGKNTQIGSIAQMIQIEEEDPPLKIKFAKLAKQLAKIVLLACLIIFIAGKLCGQDILGMLVIASALAVAGIPKGGVKIQPLKDEHLAELLKIGMLCNNSFIEHDGEWRIIGDPTEGALLVAAKKANISESHPRVTELPFDSDRKLMSTLHTTPRGITAFILLELSGSSERAL
ncbi:MAG: HAD-IC family P-type ATPase [Candidatus Methanoperedens sp.]|nr:HAD-IC family P-type ATPase [Candidatus Methanoperedens sp.]CAG0980954.1 Calcium-transporting ATPase 1 [Methanosarcinales archaeon]